jgi:hypothetical protein
LAREHFDRGDAHVFIRKVVPKINCMVEGKGPQIKIHLIWPVQHGVEEHRSRPFGKRADGTFCHGILVLCAKTREVYLLVHGVDVVKEFVGVENPIVNMIFLDFHSSDLSRPLFELLFALDSVPSTQRRLLCAKNDGGRMVNAERATNKFVFCGFAPSSMWKSAWIAEFILIE